MTDLTTWFSGSEGGKSTDVRTVESQKIPPPVDGTPSYYPDLITCFRFLPSGEWKKISWSEAHKLKIRELMSGPYVMRLDEKKVYFCGNNDAWLAIPEGRSRKWIHEVIRELFQPCADSGLTWKKVFMMDLHSALSVRLAKSILGGEFVYPVKTENKIEKKACNLNQTQESIPF